jgi:RimJ/RimL family protein N-acetyltransferase
MPETRDQSRHDTERPVVNVVGERVALGPMRRDLIPVYHRWFNDLPTRRDLGPVQTATLEWQERWYDHVATDDGSARFTLYETAHWTPIGWGSLQDVDHRNRSAELALAIGEPGYRGKGYGTEAARLLLDYGFTALGLHSVWLVAFGWNGAAIRVYEKAGFKECGRRREAWWMGGRYWDAVTMDCLASEFTSPVLARTLDLSGSRRGPATEPAG